MFTPDQLAHLKSIEGPHDQLGLASFRDRLEEDGHPLWPLFARAHAFHEEVTTPNSPFGYGAYWTGMRGKGRWSHPGTPELTTGFLTKLKDGQLSHTPGASFMAGHKLYQARLTRDELKALHDAFPPGRTRQAIPPHSKAEEPEQFARTGSLILHV